MATTKPGTTRFVANPMLEEQLKRSYMFADDLLEVANDIKDGATANAPEDEGDFKAGMRTEVGMGTDGIAARFISDDWKSVIIEYGTAEHPFSFPIRRAIESLGLKLEDR